ncbi:MAG: phage integrase central domain-containing protein [Acidimicrobiia bacterium]
MNDGDWVDPANAKRLFGEIAREWRDNHVEAASTLQKLDNDLENHIYPTFASRPIGSIRRSAIQAWVKKLDSVLAPATLEVVYRYLSTIFKAAVDDGIIARSPLRERQAAGHREASHRSVDHRAARSGHRGPVAEVARLRPRERRGRSPAR